jgi:hypothetical protein
LQQIEEEPEPMISFLPYPFWHSMYRRRSSSTTPLTFFFWAFFLAQILTVNKSFCN